MKFFKKFFDQQEKHFSEGGRFSSFYYLYEAIDSFMFTPGKVTRSGTHVRDAMDLKRMMMIVVYALIPAVFMALYNTGYQANMVLSGIADVSQQHWQARVIAWLGIGFDSANVFANLLHGALYFLPVYFVTIAAGGFWEVLFACIRKHEVHEGFLVTSLLFPLILPPTIPLWQVAIGISFGVVFGKEVFGGVGMNVLNPALVARAFLFFAYPAQISGDAVWVAVDGISSATPLAQMADSSQTLSVSWWQSFIGLESGSMGETSALACLIGAFVLIATGIGSWQIMLSVVIGMVGMSSFFNLVGSPTNPLFQVPAFWHLVAGGFAFGTVFMATDPVSAAFTASGKFIYGILLGMLVVMIRVLNPAYPEGMMLAILFMNILAPTIDRIFVQKNIKRRQLRNVV